MLKIVIVEDDPIIREELALLLENEGCLPMGVYGYHMHMETYGGQKNAQYWISWK